MQLNAVSHHVIMEFSSHLISLAGAVCAFAMLESVSVSELGASARDVWPYICRAIVAHCRSVMKQCSRRQANRSLSAYV